VVGWGGVRQSESQIMIPQIKYLTNDSWEEVSCLASGIGYPIFHSADYANSKLYVLTIPDNFGDFYNYPPEALTRIKEVLMRDLYVRVDGPSQVALFVYDDDTFIVESFLPDSVGVRIVIDKRISKLLDVLSGEVLTGEVLSGQWSWGRGAGAEKVAFEMQIKPHSYRVFQSQ
jgi:hypothetical protein